MILCLKNDDDGDDGDRVVVTCLSGYGMDGGDNNGCDVLMWPYYVVLSLSGGVGGGENGGD